MNSTDVPVTAPAPSKTTRPGWPEILVAAVVYTVMFFGAFAVARLIPDSGWRGVALGAWSGIIGLGAFFAAYGFRLRSLTAFGVRKVSWKWVLAGIGFGFAALLLTRLVLVGYVLLGGSAEADVQGDYSSAASGGLLLAVLNVVGLAVLTPLGEELAFRGVLANALRRYGFLVSTVVSTVVFALAHGINLALVPAVIVGFTAATLFWHTRSIWPGVLVHAINNGVAIVVVPILVALAG